MYGTAIFSFGNTTPVSVIPRSAFVGSVSTNQVFALENKNTARLKQVVAGRVIGDKVEVLKGLDEGETIITSGQINLSDGSKVSSIN